MKLSKRINLFAGLFSALFIIPAFANDVEGNDLYINGYSKVQLSQLSKYVHSFILAADINNYTVINYPYRQIVNNSRDQVNAIIKTLKSADSHDSNAQIALISHQLADIPYLGIGAMGEGDWDPSSTIYKEGAVHIQQDPVYRLDGFNCQTFVQVAMALLHSTNINSFDQHILKISYGAAGDHLEDGVVHFYNRNNFVSGDFNPVNEKNGLLLDTTSAGNLKPLTQTTSATITRSTWFLKKQENMANTIRVLSESDGPSMVERFNTLYSTLHFPNFDSEQVSLTYIPKEALATKQIDGSYLPSKKVFNQITVPAVVEIVRDVKKWNIGPKNIRDYIGSELNVSHMGLLYRQTFKQGEVIYQKIFCHYSDSGLQKVCDVTPVVCKKNQCNELMFAQASNAYPDGYYWYQKEGNYVCTPDKPANNVKSTYCNRVEQLPLADYITRQQYTSHPFMDTVSIVGIHIEKLL